jgi:hypothetical protein
MTFDLERLRVNLSVYTRLPSLVGIKVQDFPWYYWSLYLAA